MKQTYDEYVRSYVDTEKYIFSRWIEYQIGEIDVRMKIMECEQNEIAYVQLAKGDLRYEFSCLDYQQWEELFFRLTLDGRDYLCFRKLLYGFTLLDIQTLTVTYEYFPMQVLEGDESFIVTDAKAFDHFIVMDGCYWACPYTYAVFDIRTRRFIDLYTYYRVWSEEKGILITDDRVLLKCRTEEEESLELVLTYDDFCRLMDAHGKADF